MPALFITATGTDIGKTYVAVALACALRATGKAVRALKPVASGMPALSDAAFSESDTGRLLAAQGLERTAKNVDACSPWRFSAPLSPDMAATREGRTLALADVIAWTQAAIAHAPPDTLVLIEGVGGIMSPAASDGTNLDWLAGLGCASVLVTGSYLGTLSHTLTALAAMQARGLAPRAVIVNESEGSGVSLEDTLASLRRFALTREFVGWKHGQAASPEILSALA